MDIANLPPIGEWWDTLWRTTGMSGSLTFVAVATSIFAVSLMFVMKRKRQVPIHPTGMRCTEGAVHWAEERFTESRVPLAAHVATLIYEHFAVRLRDLEADTDLVRYLGRDGMEAVEYLAALEDSLGVTIEEDAAEQLLSVAGAVGYLHPRLDGVNDLA